MSCPTGSRVLQRGPLIDHRLQTQGWGLRDPSGSWHSKSQDVGYALVVGKTGLAPVGEAPSTAILHTDLDCVLGLKNDYAEVAS